ncbi:MAG: ABC transporter ATP-binding protein, partial [Ornithinimicrobium sp.]
MSDVVEFAGVGVTRGGNHLLRDITWSVEEGERWV